MMNVRRYTLAAVVCAVVAAPTGAQQKYVDASGALRVALVRQPLSPNGPSKGPTTMAEGGIQPILEGMGAIVRVDAARLTAEEDKEYGGWKRLGMSLGHFADLVARNERDGYFTVGLLATCPSMPGLVAGLQRSGPTREPLRIGLLWLDAHPDFNTPETTRSGSLGGMPVAVATGRALRIMRLDAKLDPALPDEHVVMGGVRLTDPLEQQLLDASKIQQLTVDDLRHQTPAVWAQLDRLSRVTDKIYVHIDMDVLDPREVMGHGNKVPNGPSSEQLAKLFEAIFAKYPKASAVGFATIPSTDEGGLSIAAVNRMIAAAVRGVKARPRTDEQHAAVADARRGRRAGARADPRDRRFAAEGLRQRSVFTRRVERRRRGAGEEPPRRARRAISRGRGALPLTLVHRTNQDLKARV
jgi:arginase